MFQKFTAYKLASALPPVAAIDEALRLAAFQPIGVSQEKSVGWVPPREENGAMVEAVAGQLIACLVIESKTVPKSEIDKAVKAAADHIEATTGRTPGRKERRALKEDALLALLPQAFPKRVRVPVWIDPKAGRVIVGATAASKTDEVVSILVRSIDMLALQQIQTVRAPQSAMAEWLSDGGAREDLHELHSFTMGRECVLQSSGDDKAVVRFARHDVENDAIRQHITEGKLPTRLALEFEGRVGFVLDDSLRVHKIDMLDGVFAESASASDDAADHFDADVAIYAGELSRMLDHLIEAMGGIIEVAGQEGATA